jgi:hypothetical protein
MTGEGRAVREDWPLSKDKRLVLMRYFVQRKEWVERSSQSRITPLPSSSEMV